MRRVGLIDITVGNAARLGASQRSTMRRCASHHIATQRASRWGYSGGSRAFNADGPHDIAAKSLRDIKRNNADNRMRIVMTDERFKQGALELGTAMAFEGDAVQRAADEIEPALRKDDDKAEGASSRRDHPIRMQ